jgi:hypothetical protein
VVDVGAPAFAASCELIDVLRRTSICGLGQVALGPVASVLRLAGGSHEG